MSVQALIRWFLPREDHFYDFLERQADVAHRSAKELARFHQGVSAAEIRDAVQELEHQGDAIVHEMLDALARTFVTPIDREDLQRLSKRLDDITDFINQAARACVLFGVEKPTPPMLGLIDKLVNTTGILMKTAPGLRKHAYNDLIEASKAINGIEKEGDDVFRAAISRLFHDPSVDAKTILREKEVLDDLEKALNRCDQVSETIMNIAVKHG